jgi:hypothetical protein
MKDPQRIGELFYDEVAGKNSITLDAFIGNALSAYRERFLDRTGMKAEYQEKGGVISLYIETIRNAPDVTRMGLFGHTGIEVIGKIPGQIDAYFSDLALTSLPGELQAVLQERRTHNFCILPGVTFVFTQDPTKTDIIQEVIVGSEDKSQLARILRTTDASGAITIIDAVLAEADLIRSDGSFYQENDPRRDLMNERFDIRRSGQMYAVSYAVDSPHHTGLPYSLLQRVDPLFSLLKHHFTKAAYHRLKFTPTMNADAEEGISDGP